MVRSHTQRSFQKFVLGEPSPATYFYNINSIAGRSLNDQRSKATRSNDYAPFSTKAQRFSASQADLTKNNGKVVAPGPSSYFPRGPMSDFGKSSKQDSSRNMTQRLEQSSTKHSHRAS